MFLVAFCCFSFNARFPSADGGLRVRVAWGFLQGVGWEVGERDEVTYIFSHSCPWQTLLSGAADLGVVLQSKTNDTMKQ